MENNSKEKIIVVGRGPFGDTIGSIMINTGTEVEYLIKSDALSKKSDETIDINILRDASGIIIALPSQAVEGWINTFPETLKRNVRETKTLVLTKGLAPTNSQKTFLSDSLGEVFQNLSFLSGPNFSADIKNSIDNPTKTSFIGTTIATRHQKDFKKWEKLLPSFHDIEFSDDIFGVQLLGAIKNIYAIFSGIVATLGTDPSTRATLVTKSRKEIRKILCFFNNAKEETFDSYAGIGDVFLTTQSKKSRNFSYGSNMTKENISNSKYIPEGYFALQKLASLLKEQKENFPILFWLHNQNPPVTIEDIVELYKRF